MRCLLGYFLTLCTALSLLLCAAVVGLWLDTQHIFMVDLNGERFALTGVADGGLIGRFSINDDAENPWHPQVETIAYHLKNENRNRGTTRYLSVLSRPQVPSTYLGFGYAPDDEIGYKRTWNVRIPYAAAVLMLLIGPALRIRRSLKSHRIPGTCSQCGYDLRATPKRCPECGIENDPHL